MVVFVALVLIVSALLFANELTLAVYYGDEYIPPLRERLHHGKHTRGIVSYFKSIERKQNDEISSRTIRM